MIQYLIINKLLREYILVLKLKSINLQLDDIIKFWIYT